MYYAFIMKRISLIILAITAILAGSVSCQKINIGPDNPVIPQGEVTREFLSLIRVGKGGDVSSTGIRIPRRLRS